MRLIEIVVGVSKRRDVFRSFLLARTRWGQGERYEEAWLYLCQALRRGGWVLEGDTFWCAVAKDYEGKERHAVVLLMSEQNQCALDYVLAVLRSAGGPEVFLIKHVEDAKGLSSSTLLP